MDLGKTVSYGMVAMGYIAKQPECRCIPAEEISKEFDIPDAYLVKVMFRLAQAGWVFPGKTCQRDFPVGDHRSGGRVFDEYRWNC
jgi:hypothetical protein